MNSFQRGIQRRVLPSHWQRFFVRAESAPKHDEFVQPALKSHGKLRGEEIVLGVREKK